MLSKQFEGQYYYASASSQISHKYTVSQKNKDTLLMSITSQKIDRFSRFFHW